MHWGLGVVALGLLYVVWARTCPRIFDRGVVEHGHPVPEGWQIGRSISWRLPGRAAVVVTILAAVLAGASRLLAPRPLGVMVILFGIGFAALWLFAPPGDRIGLFDAKSSTGGQVFVLRSSSRPLRALAVFVVFGLLPSVVIGAAVGWATQP